MVAAISRSAERVRPEMDVTMTTEASVATIDDKPKNSACPVSGHRFDPLDPAHRDDPYPVYARMRANDPVHLPVSSPDGGAPTLYLFGHADNHRWLRDPRMIREWRSLANAGESWPPLDPETFEGVAANWMLLRDPPDHTRLRGLASKAFTPRRVATWGPEIERLATWLIARARDESDGEPVDLIDAYAFPLPVLVIAQILGVPDDEYERFRAWASFIAAALDLPVAEQASFAARADDAVAELSEFLRWIVAARRTDPQDDLISAMLAATNDGATLTEDELIATLILLLVAGHETTVNLIGNGTRALLTHPMQWAALRADPGLAGNATEELLRFDSPVQMTSRLTAEAVEIGGVPVPAGTWVMFVLGSANRDPAAFQEPERLDVRREVGRIMSFGMGIHFCLGAPLARLEATMALPRVVDTLGSMRVTEEPHWKPLLVLRSIEALHIDYESQPVPALTS